MRGMITTTASSLKAILCYIDAEKTPKIAYDNDALAKPLADKIKDALGDRDGSQTVSIHWNGSDEDNAIYKQFGGVCKNIESCFSSLSFCTKD